MDADAVARMNVTVEAFAQRCLASKKPPFVALRECLTELQALPYWSEEEINRVEEATTRLLNDRLASSGG